MELINVILPLFVLMVLGIASTYIFEFLINMTLANNMALRSDIIAGSANILSMKDDDILIEFSWDRKPFAMKVSRDCISFSLKENTTLFSAYPNDLSVRGVIPENDAYYVLGIGIRKFTFLNDEIKELIIE